MSPLFALDIETTCALGCEGKCDHALSPFSSRISVVGVYAPGEARVFRSLDIFRDWLADTHGAVFVGHNLKFDLKVLAAHGINIDAARWAHDTNLMAACLTEKVSEDYLAWYAEERKRRNALLPKGVSHREGTPLSLKTLAPYFLGIEAFWENPASHDNDEYVLKDCQYTYELYEKLRPLMEAEGSYEFYESKLLPYTKMLLKMEQRGVEIDLEALAEAERTAAELAGAAKERLDGMWADAFAAYRRQEEDALTQHYIGKLKAAEAKMKAPTIEKASRLAARYFTMCENAKEKIEAFNLDSPSQLKWLLTSHFGLDVSTFDGDESTGKAVLQRLASEGRQDIGVFLEYRKQRKLSTAFFPSYREMLHKGALHCSFNPTGTRTGRLSSSGPNLQQVPSHLHTLFRARAGMRLATYDMSAIEPRVLAYYSGDPNLCRIVMNGEDFHGHSTIAFFENELKGVKPEEVKKGFPNERAVGKEIGLACIYGAGHNRVRESAMKRGFNWSEKECKERLERFKAYYAGAYAFKASLDAHLYTGAPFANILGRLFSIPDVWDVHMKGLNTLVQSSASDLVLNSAHRIEGEFKARGIAGGVLLLVHDEIVTEIPEDREAECVSIIINAMTNYKLETEHGLIPLAVEGNVSTVWKK